MKIRIFILSLFLLSVLSVAVSNAQTSGLCNSLVNLFPPNSSPLSSSATANLFSIMILILLTVFTVLGLVYAIGTAFGIDSLKGYAKREYAEAAFNLIIVIFISGGIAFAGSATAFISNVASTSAPNSAAAPQSSQVMFTSICNNYAGATLSNALTGLSVIEGESVFFGILSEFQVTANFGVGSVVSVPFAGLSPITQLINLQMDILGAIAALNAAVIILLFIIYSFFPIFLYLGIILRSIPWTRAAGGSMLALFISFYIVFPAILYPLSNPNLGVMQALNSEIQTKPPSSNLDLSNPSNLASFATQIGNTLQPGGNLIMTIMFVFIGIVSGWLAQILGVIIAFFISFDMLESFSNLLGGNIQSNGKRLFSKLI